MGTTFKIEFFYEGKKRKHKLYETRAAYDQWWAYHEKDTQYHYRAGKGLAFGIVGIVDGKVDKTVGVVPTAKEK